MISPFQIILNLLTVLTAALIPAVPAFAQRPRIAVEEMRPADPVSPVWYVGLVVLAVLLAATAAEMIRRRREAREAGRMATRRREFERREKDSINLRREVNWAKRKTALASDAPKGRPLKKRLPPKPAPELSAQFTEPDAVGPEPALLPIFGIRRIEMARPFRPLEESNEEILLDAIEQSNDELEPDPVVRDLALRILARFRTANSVEALSAVAFYDLSASLRARAVAILAEFDHESVFETLVIACADPAREVRDAAAKALLSVTFDRTEAWLRIFESDSPAQLRLVAAAVVSGDLVVRSVGRLVHRDRAAAAEAAALTALLFRAGETAEIFEILAGPGDTVLKKAIIHTIGIAGVPEAVEALFELCAEGHIEPELDEAVEAVAARFETVAR